MNFSVFCCLYAQMENKFIFVKMIQLSLSQCITDVKIISTVSFSVVNMNALFISLQGQ